MGFTVQFPKGVDSIEFIASFAQCFDGNQNLRDALLGMQDSLRQAALFPLEPLGLLACITAEEEAASVLYYALLEMGYQVPNHGKIQRHDAKVKILIFAQVIQNYFFKDMTAEFSSVIRVQRDGNRPKTSLRFSHEGHSIVQEYPLGSIVSSGDGEAGHNLAVERSVNAVLTDITPKGMSIGSQIKTVANRRNLCLYGDPDKKKRLQSVSEIEHFKGNCVVMVVVAFLVLNENGCTSSMNKLVKEIFEKLSTKVMP